MNLKKIKYRIFKFTNIFVRVGRPFGSIKTNYASLVAVRVSRWISAVGEQIVNVSIPTSHYSPIYVNQANLD